MIYAISPVIISSFPTTLIFVKIERSLIRNPDNPQSPQLPLYKEILQFLTKLQKKSVISISRLRILSPFKGFYNLKRENLLTSQQISVQWFHDYRTTGKVHVVVGLVHLIGLNRCKIRSLRTVECYL